MLYLLIRFIFPQFAHFLSRWCMNPFVWPPIVGICAVCNMVSHRLIFICKANWNHLLMRMMRTNGLFSWSRSERVLLLIGDHRRRQPIKAKTLQQWIRISTYDNVGKIVKIKRKKSWNMNYFYSNFEGSFWQTIFLLIFSTCQSFDTISENCFRLLNWTTMFIVLFVDFNRG